MTKESSNSAAASRAKRVLIVDDHPLVRERLAEVIQREPDLEVCGEADDRSLAFRLVRELKPDVALVDLGLRNSHGLELIKDIHAAGLKVRILVISMHEESLYAERVIRAGAHGYITKQEATRKMLAALRKVLAGGLYLGEPIAEQILGRLVANPGVQSAQPSDLLSDREMQVLELLGRGFLSKQISEHLSIDTKTVDTYRARIKKKLKLRDTTDLLQFAIRWCADQPSPDPKS